MPNSTMSRYQLRSSGWLTMIRSPARRRVSSVWGQGGEFFTATMFLQVCQAADHFRAQHNSRVAGVGDQQRCLGTIRYVAEVVVDLTFVIGHEVGIANRQVVRADALGMM